MKEIGRRMGISFAISSFMGLLVNLIVDSVMNTMDSFEGFISMTPEFAQLFPTPAIAAYVNVILYGLIGAAFAGMTFVFEFDKIGFMIQYVIYFFSTSVVIVCITMILWQLQKYPIGFICSLIGYAVSFLIVGMAQYRALKRDIMQINEMIVGDTEPGRRAT